MTSCSRLAFHSNTFHGRRLFCFVLVAQFWSSDWTDSFSPWSLPHQRAPDQSWPGADRSDTFVKAVDGVRHGYLKRRGVIFNIHPGINRPDGMRRFPLSDEGFKDWALFLYCISSHLCFSIALIQCLLMSLDLCTAYPVVFSQAAQTLTPLIHLSLFFCHVKLIARCLVFPLLLGKKVGEEAVSLNPTCADSHQW